MAKLSITAPAPNQVPAAATGAGIAANTIKGLLGRVPLNENPYLKVAADIGQGIARTVGSVGLSAINKTLSLISPKSATSSVEIPSYLHPLFGADEKTISDIPTRAQEASLKINENPLAKKYGLDKISIPLAYGSIAATTALDLAGMGGEKAAVKTLIKETDPKLVAGLLEKIGISPKVAEKFAPDFVTATTPKEVEHALEIAKASHGLTILSDAEKNAMDLYQTNRNANLPEAQKEIEQNAFGEIQKQGGLPTMADNYIRENGIIVNTDNARELFPAYQADRSLSAAVHEPSSLVTKAAYDRLLQTEAGKGDNTVLFTGGGTGAGKSSALSAIEGSAKPAIVYDGNLSSFKSSVDKIEKALDAGYKVQIRYVYRDPIEALTGGALPRAEAMAAEKGSGRTVPLNEHLNTHLGVPKTAIALSERYRNDPRVDIQTIDNSHGAGNAQIVDTMDFFKKKVYSKRNAKELRQQASKALEAEYKAGNISEATYRGTQDIPGKGRTPKQGNGELTKPVSKEEVPKLEQTPAHTFSDLGQGKDGKEWSSLIKGFSKNLSAKGKVHIFDYAATPEFVLEKIGLGKSAEMLQEAKYSYKKTLKAEIDRIQAWKKEVGNTPGASERIFKYLDGEARFVKREMSASEIKVAEEIKTYLKEWADRLKLPEDNRIGNYITHIFEEVPGEGIKPSVFDEDPELAAIMEKLPAGSVYDPFLQQRLGKKGYRQDAWAALDAYVKRGSRKEAMDPALEFMKKEAKNLDDYSYKYVTNLTHRINMRPTEIDKGLDNFIKQTPGLRSMGKGVRPIMNLTRKIRNVFYRGTLGLNISSALRNLSQGANTYAKLGEKYTVVGYTKLFARLLTRNLDDLKEYGILEDELVQDKKLGVYKSILQKVDPILYAQFSLAEKINRGAAFYGAKSKAIAKGLSEAEAIKYGQRMVRETQFAFGAVDSPTVLSSDIAKTVGQLQSYNLKQGEFLIRMLKNKEFAGLIRYTVGTAAFLYSIGKMFGMTWSQVIPTVGLGGSPIGNLSGGILELATAGGDSQKQAEGISKLKRAAVTIVPAGAQIKKTVQGIQAYNEGRDKTPSGRTRFKIPQNTATQLQTAVFGKSSIPAAQEYYSSLGKKKSSSGKAKLSI